MVIINYYYVISCIHEYNTLCNLESIVYLRYRVFSVCYVELCALHFASVLDDKTKDNTTHVPTAPAKASHTFPFGLS